jgi:hypothetical protein
MASQAVAAAAAASGRSEGPCMAGICTVTLQYPSATSARLPAVVTACLPRLLGRGAAWDMDLCKLWCLLELNSFIASFSRGVALTNLTRTPHSEQMSTRPWFSCRGLAAILPEEERAQEDEAGMPCAGQSRCLTLVGCQPKASRLRR